MKLLNQLVREIEHQGALLDDISGAGDRLAVDLPYPRVFKELLECHSFACFEVGGVRVFSNIEGEEDNLQELLADALLTQSLVDAGFLPFGRPVNCSYDRVCFDVRKGKCLTDAVVVLIDHEGVLAHGTVGRPKMLARGIMQLLGGSGAERKGS